MKKTLIFILVGLSCCALLTSCAQSRYVHKVFGGNPCVNRAHVDSAEGILFFDLNNPISSDGVIGSWRIYASPKKSGTGRIKLKIFRDTGKIWRFIGESPLEKVNQWGKINTFSLPATIAVKKGDIIAWWYPDGTIPSVVFDDGGRTMNHHEWPWRPIGDIKRDIPNLLSIYKKKIKWNATTWDINSRIYSIEVLSLK